MTMIGVISESDKDSLFKDCLEIIKKEGKASTSLLQRKLQIGYNRAARIIDQLESMDTLAQQIMLVKEKSILKNLLVNEEIYLRLLFYLI